MADNNKRNSVAGKVATPKASSSAQPTIDTVEALSKAVGAHIKLTTTAPLSQTYDGTLFTADPILNIVALNSRITGSTAAIGQPGEYHLIPVSRIHSFQILSLAGNVESGESGFTTAQPAIGKVDIDRLKKREQERVTKLQEDERNRGKGVTKEAQAIFDSFKRINMPIRWHNQEMIVHEAVIISPPYRTDDCRCPKEKQEVLNRVKKVLEGERRKLKEKEEQALKASSPAGQRKGG